MITEGLFCLTPYDDTNAGNWFLPGSPVPVTSADEATVNDQVSINFVRLAVCLYYAK